MKTHTSCPAPASWFTRLFASSLLLSALPAHAASIYGLADDRQVSSMGALTDGTPMMSGYSGTTAYNPVVVFQLPSLPAGKEFSAASLRLYLQGKTGTPTFNGDLYALGVSASSAVLSTDHYSGASDPGALLIQNNLITPSASGGAITASDVVLTDFLNAAYANGTGAGQYVFFRVSPDVAGLNNYTRYNLYSAEYSGGSYYWPSITYGTADTVPAWSSVPLGGGGYVTGLVSNTDGSAIYCRTDVGGVFRWTPDLRDSLGNGSWVSLSDTLVPFGTANAKKLMGAESIATDPANPDRIYAGAGNQIFVSDDRGDTWTQINPSLAMGPNAGDTRFYGERLAVDPNNPNLIWYGSIQDGLQKGVKSGGTWTWSQVPNTSVPFGVAPSGGSNAGVTFVACDKNGGSTITYAGVFDGAASPTTGGVYKTTDGVNWTKVALSTGSFNTPRRAQISGNGTLYVTGGTNGVFKLLRGGSLAPVSALATGVDYYNGVAIDPNDATGNTVYVASRSSATLWRSTNGGTSWSVQNPISQTRQEPDGTPTLTGYWFGNTSSLLVNPANSNELWAGDFFGVLRTRNAQDLGVAGSTWNILQKGQEETVVLGLLNAPAGPKLVTALADVGGYYYNNASARPTGAAGGILANPSNANTTSLDFSEANNNAWARAWVGVNGNGSGAFSPDAGVSWLMFGQVAQQTINSGSAAWETWDLTTYLATQQAKGVTTVTLVIASDNATNFSGTPVNFDSKEAADTSLKPKLVLNGSSTLNPTADTYVSGATASVGTNYGSAVTLQASHAYTSSITNDRHIYLKFDLTGAATITSATLQLHRIAATAGIQYKVGVFACSDTGWGETTLVWTGRPLPYACSNAARNPFAEPRYKTSTNVALSGGRVAVSSTDANNLVWVPVGTGNKAYYSKDRGVTWTVSTGGPNSEISGVYTNGNSLDISGQCLAADRANGNFYMADFAASGAGSTHKFYVSSDSGATWTLASTPSNGGSYNARTPQLVAAPSGGDVWFCDDADYNGYGGGLWHSTNSASAWTKLSNVNKVSAVSFGKASSGSGYAVYIYGYVGTVLGVHRSDDYGVTWTKLADPTIARVTALAGDRQNYGRVFIGTGGRGVFQFQ